MSFPLTSMAKIFPSTFSCPVEPNPLPSPTPAEREPARIDFTKDSYLFSGVTWRVMRRPPGRSLRVSKSGQF